MGKTLPFARASVVALGCSHGPAYAVEVQPTRSTPDKPESSLQDETASQTPDAGTDSPQGPSIVVTGSRVTGSGAQVTALVSVPPFDRRSKAQPRRIDKAFNQRNLGTVRTLPSIDGRCDRRRNGHLCLGRRLVRSKFHSRHTVQGPEASVRLRGRTGC